MLGAKDWLVKRQYSILWFHNVHLFPIKVHNRRYDCEFNSPHFWWVNDARESEMHFAVSFLFQLCIFLYSLITYFLLIYAWFWNKGTSTKAISKVDDKAGQNQGKTMSHALETRWPKPISYLSSWMGPGINGKCSWFNIYNQRSSSFNLAICFFISTSVVDPFSEGVRPIV